MTQFSSVYSLDDGQLPYFPQVLPENTLIDLQVTQLDVLQALSSLAGKHSSGPDDLKADFLYKIRSHLVKPLQMIFNASLRSSDVPSDWKNAVVVPCYKRNNKPNCPASYRPISLTNICCKILEFIILKYLKAYFLESCINFNCQHGFIAKRSTLTNLLETLNDITSFCNDGFPVDLIYLDVSKAFDSVSHEKIIFKLKKYGIGGNLLNWIKNFLTGRTQCVRVGNYISPPLPPLQWPRPGQYPRAMAVPGNPGGAS